MLQQYNQLKILGNYFNSLIHVPYTTTADDQVDGLLRIISESPRKDNSGDQPQQGSASTESFTSNLTSRDFSSSVTIFQHINNRC